ncbi:MAG: competence/damage-inducible protein A [Candidatus Bathyarchaeota archaeon]|jgi:molybdenum cofactor synthesis domain-containing protein|nr:competence/damage-inducible protein A [Candidatus Bathyarchaeota archaeon]
MSTTSSAVKHKGSPRVEVIATGDELIYGRILDTNSNWLAKRLAEIGAELRRVTMVGDDYDDMKDALLGALDRDAEIIVFTGGLGPSEDDFTVNAIGCALGREITTDTIGFQKIKEIYERRGSDLKRGARMARILEGSEGIQNHVGMSVGMKLLYNGKLIFTLPGVPQEMQGMFNEHITPVIEAEAKHKLLGHTYGVAMVWKDFFPVYTQLQEDYPEVYIKNAATPPEAEEDRSKVKEIKVDIVIQGATMGEAEKKMKAFMTDYKCRIDAAGGGTIRRL